MPLRIDDIALPLAAPESELAPAVSRLLGVPPQAIDRLRIRRKALDARQRGRFRLVYTLEAALRVDEKRIAQAVQDRRVVYLERLPAPAPVPGTKPIAGRAVVVGAGPAGLFAALELAENGYRPLVLERGSSIEKRPTEVAAFWKEGALDPESNVFFGEGGAGAFSDGKLTTRTHDPRIERVYDTFLACGVPEETLRWARPHLGSDRLPGAVRRLRERIQSLGGEFRFRTRVDDFVLRDGSLAAVRTSAGDLDTNLLVLAAGHSAHDVYRRLHERGIPLEPKPFQAGIRVECPQDFLDSLLLGSEEAVRIAGHAEYTFAFRPGHDRAAVHTFCMCPGGLVIGCSAEEGLVNTNGMSRSARNGPMANAGLVVTLDTIPNAELRMPNEEKAREPDEFFRSVPALAGIAFQRMLERRAFAAGGGRYQPPSESLRHFLGNRSSIKPLLPESLYLDLRRGAVQMDRRLPGLVQCAGAYAVESRTTAPVRVLRGPDGQSPAAAGLFPAGEGAGYAGGIVSAAVDGLRTAESAIRVFAR